ncbi:hypothetical protein P22_3198 [Propionispora sp. 2/2-37]|uniref:ABC transporter permease n=1 Tax=Propionispora sp. 2/2-37 TaxID=1677858 RepID=UPI0006BB733D|nr:ABC transporter permease [Propionispora sp. 2/2-37]CUH97072.1 hypothetical protein P22_3198 [Propionispora sp. 2/2-37]
MIVRIPKVVTDKAAVILFVLAWELSARLELVNNLFIPPLSKVLATVWHLLISDMFLQHILISLARSMGGFAVAVIVAIPLGLIMGGWFHKLELALEPLFAIAAQANPFILFHVIILFLGIGEATKVTIIAWICIWPILFNTMNGVRHVDTTLLKAAMSFGLKRWKIFWKIILPAAAPSIFTGLRLSAGYSFFLLIAAEMMGSSSGLGWFVLYSQENFNIQWIFAGAVVIALLGLAIDALLAFIEKRLIVWRQAG